MAAERSGAVVQRRQSSGAEESARLSALRGYCVLDTGREARFDDLTSLAANICETPVSLVSLVDTNRLFFKSALGMDIREVPHPDFFCGQAIRQRDVFVVPDATQDPRFANHPLVVESPRVCFYAGAPLVTPQNYALGTLCVVDFVPRALNSRAEALRKTIEQARIPAGDGSLKLTVSIGLASFPSYGDSGQAVLRAADVALYKAKAAGRNRVIMCTPSSVRASSPAKAA